MLHFGQSFVNRGYSSTLNKRLVMVQLWSVSGKAAYNLVKHRTGDNAYLALYEVD